MHKTESKEKRRKLNLILPESEYELLEEQAQKLGLTAKGYAKMLLLRDVESSARSCSGYETPEEQEVLSVSEIASRLNKTQRTVYRMIKDGVFGERPIKAKGIKAQYFVKKAAFEGYLKEHTLPCEDAGANYISTAEAASLMHVEPGTVRGWIFRNKLKGIKSRNNAWLINRDDLDEFAKEYLNKPKYRDTRYLKH